ncbi:hypothetical protein O9929_26695 [Vibrio lentus]|nr:hypothetical protein [Vibrio lentus]
MHCKQRNPTSWSPFSTFKPLMFGHWLRPTEIWKQEVEDSRFRADLYHRLQRLPYCSAVIGKTVATTFSLLAGFFLEQASVV